MSSLNPYRRALKRGLFWGLFVAVVASAFALGRWSVNFDALGFVPIYSYGLPVDRREDTFLAIVKDWQTYLSQNDGFIPEDPYRGLLATGPAWTFNSLREVYFAPYLPPRLNINLSKNPRYVVFSYRPSFPSGEFNWEYYADGSWAKVPVTNRSAMDAGSSDVDNWVHDFPKTGLSDWKLPGERTLGLPKTRTVCVGMNSFGNTWLLLNPLSDCVSGECAAFGALVWRATKIVSTSAASTIGFANLGYPASLYLSLVGDYTHNDLLTQYLYIFTNRVDTLAHGGTIYEVNIPSAGMNLDYYEKDTTDPTNQEHNTSPSTTAPYTGTWPDEDQLHHFVGYLFTGALFQLSPFTNEQKYLIQVLKATGDYYVRLAPNAPLTLANTGDYDLGVVGWDLGVAYEKNPSDITQTITTYLTDSFAQVNVLDGRGTNLP